MKEQLMQYFLEEKTASMFLLLIGASGIVIASYLLKYSSKKWLIGLSYPMSIISVLITALGGFIYWRTPVQLEQLNIKLLGTPHSYYELELQRMDGIINNFTYYNYIEIGLIGLGLILCIVAIKTRGFVFGAGLSLLFYGTILLGFDNIANERAHRYHQSLIKHSKLE